MADNTTTHTWSIDVSHLNDVRKLIIDVADEWMNLGLELGILYTTLRKIDHEERGRIESCKREMIAAWLRGDDNAREQTWSTLVDALKSIDQNTLAEKIISERM